MSGFSSGGRCLCGSVRFKVTAESAGIGLCHCKMCRRWGGGLPLTAMHAVVEMVSDDGLQWWRSSGWGERGFCGRCGSSLFWRLQDASDARWTVSVGALDEEAGLEIDEHIFHDDKAGFYETVDAAPRLSGAAFTAKVLRQLAARDEGFLPAAMKQLRAHSGAAFADEVERLLDAG